VPQKEGGTPVLNKAKIFDTGNCHIHQRSGTKSKYRQFYFGDSEGRKRIRIIKSLRAKDSLANQSLAQKEYIHIRAKIQKQRIPTNINSSRNNGYISCQKEICY
jgi:hypothetical protein